MSKTSLRRAGAVLLGVGLSSLAFVSVALGQAAPGQPGAPAPAEAPKPGLNPLDQVLHGSWPIIVIFLLLVAMATVGILIAILKALQVSRMRTELHRFERESFNAAGSGDLFEAARRNPGSPGGRVVLAIARRGGSAGVLEGVAKRAIVGEQQRASALMPLLASVASAAPFVGLLGTVYGIMEAFLRIGQEKSASLPVVAPAIGEALVTTLVGLVAAIPALVTYNLINKWVDNLISELEAAAGAWVTIIADSDRVSAAPNMGANNTTARSAPPAPY